MYHLIENKDHRQKRLNTYSNSANALCSTGDFHAKKVTGAYIVTCPKCLELLRQYPNANKRGTK